MEVQRNLETLVGALVPSWRTVERIGHRRRLSCSSLQLVPRIARVDYPGALSSR